MTRPKPKTEIQIRFAAKLARARKRINAASAARAARKRAERNAPRLELLGAAPDPAWLATIGKAQADLRSAIACLDTCRSLLSGCRGPIPIRAIHLAYAESRALQSQLRALMPTSICPHCHATDPACQPCGGRGVLSVGEAAQIPHELLHDRE
jgi:hypothetical protein